MAKDIIKYGCVWPTGDPVKIEMECIRRNGRWTDQGRTFGEGLDHHIRELARYALPWVYWHRWGKMCLKELCAGHRRLTIFGAASSQKTFIASLYAWAIYSAMPRGTTVLVSTTTREMLNLRIWGEIKKIWRKAKERVPWLPGCLIESGQMLTTDGKEVEGREFRDGIIGRPVKKGSEWVGLGDFVGIKNDRVIVIADEYHLMPDAIGRSMANLAANEGSTFIALGNLGDLSTPLGDACEPEYGWDAISDSEKARVYKTKFFRGFAVQLPGADSPNLDWPEGAEPFKKLIGRNHLIECEQNYGKGTPLYNMMAGGAIPRGSLEMLVLPVTICRKFNTLEPVTWGSEALTKLYCADINYSFGHGDKSVGIPLAFGWDVEGKMRLALLERPFIPSLNEKLSGTHEEQLTKAFQQECERLDIPPERFFFDGTGRSSFTYACMRIWSPSVRPVEFGGAATKRPNFAGRKYTDGLNKGDLLPCNEVFAFFVSELWFALRFAAEADQIRNLTEEIVKEAGKRHYMIVLGNKMKVEPKVDMRKRLGRSPDETDALVVGLEGARQLGFPLGKLGQEMKGKRDFSWLKKLRDTRTEKWQQLQLTA